MAYINLNITKEIINNTEFFSFKNRGCGYTISFSDFGIEVSTSRTRGSFSLKTYANIKDAPKCVQQAVEFIAA